MEPAATDSSPHTSADPAPTSRTPTDCTCPTQARELLDRLEEKIGPLHGNGHGVGLHEDFAREVPGAAEPPD